ncbi:ubiquinol-cytochrome c reductase iron-sulfur subunit [Chloroflexota bacterium]
MRRIVNFFKALFGKCGTESLPSENWTVEEDGKITIKLGESELPELCEQGKAVYLKGQGLKRPILVIRTEADTYLAYTNRCTHSLHRKLDPTTGPDPGQPILRCCSLGHSTFDYEGNVLSGPAKNPLDRHEIEMSDGNLVITLKVPVVEEAAAEAETAEEAAPEPGAPEETAAEAEKAEEPVGEASAAEETVSEPETTEETET